MKSVLIAVLAVSSCSGCAAAQRPSQGRSRAQDFALRDLDGDTVRLSEYLGKQVVLINFWATWCAPCQGEMPHLEALYQKHRDRGLVVLGVSMDGAESVANVAPAMRRLGVTYPVLWDEETRVVGLYNPKRAAPFTVLIGRDGAVRKTFEGYSSGDEVKLEQELVRLLDEGAP